jgi:hypothetical protein
MVDGYPSDGQPWVDERSVFPTKEKTFDALRAALRNQPPGEPFHVMPVKLTKTELAEFIADELCETDPEPIARIAEFVVQLKQTPAFNLLRKVNELEAAGGVLVRDGSRRKTPGGLWLMLAGRRVQFLEKEKRKLEAVEQARKGAELRTAQRKARVRGELRAATATKASPQTAPVRNANPLKTPEVVVIRRASGGGR